MQVLLLPKQVQPDLLKTIPHSQDFTFVREMMDLGTKLLGDDKVVRESKDETDLLSRENSLI